VVAVSAMVQDVAAQEVKGVQIPLLQCWGSGGRAALKQILNRQQRVAISSAPYMLSAEGAEFCKVQNDRLANIKDIVNGFTMPEAHVILFVGNLHAKSVESHLKTRFALLWAGLIKPNRLRMNLYWHVGASLEDELSSTQVESALGVMASGIPAAEARDFKTLVDGGRFTFHRSPVRTGNANYTSATVSVNGASITVPVTHEKHGRTPDNSLNREGKARYQFWSNDGPFVYYNRTSGGEVRRELCACGFAANDASGAPLTLSAFNSTQLEGRFRLLWRPAYNLFDVDDSVRSGTVTRTFTKTKEVRVDGATNGFATNGRNDWEEEVLEKFFGN
jgi:hypothetical protein